MQPSCGNHSAYAIGNNRYLFDLYIVGCLNMPNKTIQILCQNLKTWCVTTLPWRISMPTRIPSKTPAIKAKLINQSLNTP